MINKKAQIATALLVMIALGFSIVALYAIITFSDGFKFQSSELEKIANQLNVEQKEIIRASKDFGKVLVVNCKLCSKDQLLQKGQEFDAQRSMKFTGTGNFFGKLRNGEFTFSRENDLYKLEINDLFVQTSSGNTILKRNFDICQLFDSSGEFVTDCVNVESSISGTDEKDLNCTIEKEYGSDAKGLLDSLIARFGIEKEYACGKVLDETIEGNMGISGDGQRRQIILNPNGNNPCLSKKDLESCRYFADQNTQIEVSTQLINSISYMTGITDGQRGICCGETCIMINGNCCAQPENYQQKQTFCIEYVLSFPETLNA